MNTLRSICFVLLAASLALPYEEKSLPNLVVPSQIEPQTLEFNIAHRFYRNPAGDFPDNIIFGADVKLGLRYMIWKKLEVGACYQLNPYSAYALKEYSLQTAYSLFFPKIFLRTQAYVQLYGTEAFSGQPWTAAGLYQIDLQSDPILGWILPVVNLIYDGGSRTFGLGTGLDLAVFNNLDLFGEYFPNIGARDSAYFGGATPGPKVNAFTAGVKITTYGHHFMLLVGNGTEIGVRRLMRGTPGNNIYFGFTIQRLFSL